MVLDGFRGSRHGVLERGAGLQGWARYAQGVPAHPLRNAHDGQAGLQPRAVVCLPGVHAARQVLPRADGSSGRTLRLPGGRGDRGAGRPADVHAARGERHDHLPHWRSDRV